MPVVGDCFHDSQTAKAGERGGLVILACCRQVFLIKSFQTAACQDRKRSRYFQAGLGIAQVIEQHSKIDKKIRRKVVCIISCTKLKLSYKIFLRLFLSWSDSYKDTTPGLSWCCYIIRISPHPS